MQYDGCVYSCVLRFSFFSVNHKYFSSVFVIKQEFKNLCHSDKAWHDLIFFNKVMISACLLVTFSLEQKKHNAGNLQSAA